MVFPKDQEQDAQSVLITYIQHCTIEGLTKAVRQGNELKGMQIVKEEIKQSLFADVIVYLENPKESTKNWLEIINKLSKVAVLEMSIQKSIVFLYTCNGQF